MSNTIELLVRRGTVTSTLRFDASTEPTLRSLLCVQGTMMILSEDDTELYTDLSTPLTSLPSLRVVLRDWTVDSLNAHTAVFIDQANTIMADLDYKMSQESKGSARYWEMFQHRTNLKEVVARLSTK